MVSWWWYGSERRKRARVHSLTRPAHSCPACYSNIQGTTTTDTAPLLWPTLTWPKAPSTRPSTCCVCDGRKTSDEPRVPRTGPRRYRTEQSSTKWHHAVQRSPSPPHHHRFAHPTSSRSLTHSPTHALTHSLIRALTHALTHSLTHGTRSCTSSRPVEFHGVALRGVAWRSAAHVRHFRHLLPLGPRGAPLRVWVWVLVCCPNKIGDDSSSSPLCPSSSFLSTHPRRLSL